MELVVLTPLLLVTFLRARGESDPLALHVLFLGSMILGGVSILALLKVGFNRHPIALEIGR